MIADSRFYKNDLLDFTDQIEWWLQNGRWVDRRWYEFERGLVVAFFAVRRLIESHKLSIAIANQSLLLQRYECAGKPVTLMNRFDLDELYDIERPTAVRKPLLFVANQIIHSYVLAYWKERRNVGVTVFFSSDRERNKSAYSVSTGVLIPLFRSVGSDYPDSGTFRFNDKRQDYEVLFTSSKSEDRRTRRRGRALSR